MEDAGGRPNASTKTVLYVDLVEYSDVAYAFEENFDARTVATLNVQIQTFIDRGVAAAGGSRAENVIKTTGDGAILLFNTADQAHICALAIHDASAEHNQSKTHRSAKRWFRIGVATGDVAFTTDAQGNNDVAGVTVARAQRLESAASSGCILVDKPSWNLLSALYKPLYGDEIVIRGKRDEVFSVRRLQVIPDAQLGRSASEGKEGLSNRFGWPWWVGGTVAVIAALVLVVIFSRPAESPASISGTGMTGMEARDLLAKSTGKVSFRDEWLEKLILHLETEQLRELEKQEEDRQRLAALEKPDSTISRSTPSMNWQVLVFRSDPLSARRRLKLKSRAYVHTAATQLDVLSFLRSGSLVRPLEEIVSNNHDITLDIDNVQQNDELWILILAASKELPGVRQFSLEVIP